MEMRFVPSEDHRLLPNIISSASGCCASSKAFLNDRKFCWRSSHRGTELYILRSIVDEVWVSAPRAHCLAL